MFKPKIIQKHSEYAVFQERIFLSRIRHKFITNMICSFQDYENLYLGLELMKGGDLRYHLMYNTKSFTESIVKFLLANLILGIEYIHSQGIIHRDFKPENILFDEKGYAHITDFNISCKEEDINKNKDLCGTPIYMAPESIFREEQSKMVDFYSLGIVAFECLLGQRPYEANDIKEVKSILKNNIFKINEKGLVTKYCAQFINDLIKKNPKERLGSQSGVMELKENLFFKGFNWEYLDQKKFISPFEKIIKYSKKRDKLADEIFDFDYCNKSFEIDDELKYIYSEIMAKKNYSKIFRHYSHLNKQMVANLINKYNKQNKLISFPSSRSTKDIFESKNSFEKGRNLSHKYFILRDRLKDTRFLSTKCLLNYYKYKSEKYKELLKKNQKYFHLYKYGAFPLYPYYKSPYEHNLNKYFIDDMTERTKSIRSSDYKYVKIPNQFQINNYFPPPPLLSGMNPYNLINPLAHKNNSFFLPFLYTKDRIRHHPKQSSAGSGTGTEEEESEEEEEEEEEEDEE